MATRKAKKNHVAEISEITPETFGVREASPEAVYDPPKVRKPVFLDAKGAARKALLGAENRLRGLHGLLHRVVDGAVETGEYILPTESIERHGAAMLQVTIADESVMVEFIDRTLGFGLTNEAKMEEVGEEYKKLLATVERYERFGHLSNTLGLMGIRAKAEEVLEACAGVENPGRTFYRSVVMDIATLHDRLLEDALESLIDGVLAKDTPSSEVSRVLSQIEEIWEKARTIHDVKGGVMALRAKLRAERAEKLAILRAVEKNRARIKLVAPKTERSRSIV